ncbi:helix-turn-helix domain-containing protein [Nicoliella spurrieriana]|uniref:Helix-turn-helix domain-containing protein n=1 Tax=Nicoliella spurrieriana TaxID=2925830 RepID=A0A976X5P1_9LACO|nr:helix-turn-helix domain-containing protein [Nicoliella spurrieriana]UQS87105.1 helix-turn-helix domain-containing protein [Nicoliella spurrieriana]
MEFATVLKNKRKSAGLTQQQLADQLHVTRQTLSRWENDLSYPNLDTLVDLGGILNVTLDELLRGENNTMVNQISNDVRAKQKYKRSTVILASGLGVLCILLLWLGILGYGRATQNEYIDAVNPFLKTQVGYATLPAKSPALNKKVSAYVSDDQFGYGSWLKFYTGAYSNKQRWAAVKHKGSYVSSIRLIPKNQIPISMRQQVGSTYMGKLKDEPVTAKRIAWWPFD